MADKKTELQELKKMNAKPQKNSGRGMYQKGDGILEPFVVDVKEAKASFTLNKNIWSKICSDSAKHKLEPSLMIALGENNSTVRLWIIGDSMFKQMHDAWVEKYGDNYE